MYFPIVSQVELSFWQKSSFYRVGGRERFFHCKKCGKYSDYLPGYALIWLMTFALVGLVLFSAQPIHLLRVFVLFLVFDTVFWTGYQNAYDLWVTIANFSWDRKSMCSSSDWSMWLDVTPVASTLYHLLFSFFAHTIFHFNVLYYSSCWRSLGNTSENDWNVWVHFSIPFLTYIYKGLFSLLTWQEKAAFNPSWSILIMAGVHQRVYWIWNW